MKKLLLIPVLVLLTIAFCLSSFKCAKDSTVDCTTVFCTEIFASVGVHITDLSMTPMALTVYTIRNSTGEKLTFTQNTKDGIYTVLDDSYHLKIANRTETFTFVGVKNGTKVFSESYIITADCCHVRKLSGKDSITIP